VLLPIRYQQFDNFNFHEPKKETQEMSKEKRKKMNVKLICILKYHLPDPILKKMDQSNIKDLKENIKKAEKVMFMGDRK